MAGDAQDGMALIPRPVKCERLPGTFAVRDSTPVYGADLATRGLLAHYLRELAPAGDAGEGRIMLAEAAIRGGHPEGYRVTVSPGGVLLEAASHRGFAQAVQRIRQLLLDGPELPCCLIEDAPRFAWRGAHIDVARHMPPIAWLHRFVDLIALHGFTTLHIHLTDDQGWRMEIERYPLLTEVGAWRERTMLRANPEEYEERRYGGFYTKAELRGLVEYAAVRGIGIVPEIDMPGHMTAAIASYPELGNTGERVAVSGAQAIHEGILNVAEPTFAFLGGVLEEVLDVFPSPYIHLGGDEVPVREWAESSTAQARIASEGLPDTDALHGWFMRRMAGGLHTRGRRMVGWDEVVDAGLPLDSIIMSWRGETGGLTAALAGHDVVMTPTRWTYFDYYQSRDRAREPHAIGGHMPLERVYEYEPIPDGMALASARHVLGTQFQLWTEYMRTPDHMEYMAFPRACALAEVAWSPKEARDWPDFQARLAVHLRRLDRLGVNYRRPTERISS